MIACMNRKFLALLAFTASSLSVAEVPEAGDNGAISYTVQRHNLPAHPLYGKVFSEKHAKGTTTFVELVDFKGKWTIEWNEKQVYQRLTISKAKRDCAFLFDKGFSIFRNASSNYGKRVPGFANGFPIPLVLPFNLPNAPFYSKVSGAECWYRTNTLPNGDPVYDKAELVFDAQGRIASLRVTDYGDEPILTAQYEYGRDIRIESVSVPDKATVGQWERPDMSGNRPAVEPARQICRFIISLDKVSASSNQLPIRPENLFAAGDSIQYLNSDGTGVGIDFAEGSSIDRQSQPAFELQARVEEDSRNKLNNRKWLTPVFALLAVAIVIVTAVSIVRQLKR